MKFFNIQKLNIGSAILLSFLVQTISPPVTAATIKSSMNQIALLLSSASTINALNILDVVPNNEEINLIGSFSENGFTSNATGIVDSRFFNLNYTGTLIGDIGDDIIVSMSSNGNLGSEIISTTSTLTLNYDPIANKYMNAVYEELGEINPLWKIIIILVLIFTPTTLGDGEARIQSPPPPAPPSGFITDKTYRSTVIIDSEEKLCTVILDDPLFTKSCNVNDNQITATFIIASIPEPSSTLSLLSLGILGAGSTLKRNLKRTHSTEKEPANVG